MKSYETITVEARQFACPRESCRYEWLCYKWKDYVQCPICHATITLNPKRQPRASYNKKSVQKGNAGLSTPLTNLMERTQLIKPLTRQSDDYD
ncbi:MAG: hypothetical protein ACRD5J_14660 [Nitrososphaeraceae archaeon]